MGRTQFLVITCLLGLAVRADFVPDFSRNNKQKYSNKTEALLYAVIAGDLERVTNLVEKDGADVNAKGYIRPGGDLRRELYGAAPMLHWAANQYHPKIVEYLVQHGADITQLDSRDETALQVVSRAVEEVKALRNYKIPARFVGADWYAPQWEEALGDSKADRLQVIEYLTPLRARLAQESFYADLQLPEQAQNIMRSLIDLAIAREAKQRGTFDRDMEMLFGSIMASEKIKDRGAVFNNLYVALAPIAPGQPRGAREFVGQVRKLLAESTSLKVPTPWQRKVMGWAPVPAPVNIMNPKK